jgi:hypothetical protein
VSLRDELQAVYDRHGKLTPELVMQEARPKKHPLHDRVYDRPVEEAAQSWFRHRAHELIQSVKVVYREADDNGPERSVRAWQCVRNEMGHAYQPVEKVVADSFSRQLVLRDMEREWKQLLARYETFEEFLALVSSDLQTKAA